MTNSFVTNLGHIADIGGIAVGAMILIFRDVIQKKIFPMLGKEQAYRLLRLVMVLSWSIALVGIFAWVYEAEPTPVKGTLEVSDALVDCYRPDLMCLVDFRVRNSGNRPVSLSRIRVDPLQVESIDNIRVAFPIAAVGDIDLSDVTVPGTAKEIAVARLLKPGETERLGLKISAQLPTGTFRRWDLRYELVADGGITYKARPAPSTAVGKLFRVADRNPSSDTLEVTLPWDIEAHLRAPVN
jgi:hypothetical protein